MSNVETLIFDDKTYVMGDLSEQARYFVNQLQDLDQQGINTRARLDQIEIARQGFENLLREEINKEE